MSWRPRFWVGSRLRGGAAGLALVLPVLIVAALPGRARAADAAPACAIELILALDVSGSIDRREFDLETEGLAAAFETPALVSAVSQIAGGVLVTVTQWTGSSRQRQVTAWHHLTDVGSMAGFAAEIRSTPRVWRNFSTAIGEALTQARRVSATAPMHCRRRVIDVSGDGVSNEGRPPRPIAQALAGQGYTINGLVIRGADPDPVAFYRAEVVAGPGAFVEVAQDFNDYRRAILRKLLREIDQPIIVSDAQSPEPDQ